MVRPFVGFGGLSHSALSAMSFPARNAAPNIERRIRKAEMTFLPKEWENEMLKLTAIDSEFHPVANSQCGTEMDAHAIAYRALRNNPHISLVEIESTISGAIVIVQRYWE